VAGEDLRRGGWSRLYLKRKGKEKKRKGKRKENKRKEKKRKEKRKPLWVWKRRGSRGNYVPPKI
jgi:hypothetical protein